MTNRLMQLVGSTQFWLGVLSGVALGGSIVVLIWAIHDIVTR
jgi:hypothetical protein